MCCGRGWCCGRGSPVGVVVWWAWLACRASRCAWSGSGCDCFYQCEHPPTPSQTAAPLCVPSSPAEGPLAARPPPRRCGAASHGSAGPCGALSAPPRCMFLVRHLTSCSSFWVGWLSFFFSITTLSDTWMGLFCGHWILRAMSSGHESLWATWLVSTPTCSLHLFILASFSSL